MGRLRYRTGSCNLSADTPGERQICDGDPICLERENPQDGNRAGGDLTVSGDKTVYGIESFQRIELFYEIGLSYETGSFHGVITGSKG